MSIVSFRDLILINELDQLVVNTLTDRREARTFAQQLAI